MPHQARPEEIIHHPTSGLRTSDRPTTEVPDGPPQAVTSGTAGMERLRAFIDAVLAMHRVLPDRFIPMCSCGSPARHCPIVRAEHEVLGIPMPFTFDPVRPPYYEV